VSIENYNTGVHSNSVNLTIQSQKS